MVRSTEMSFQEQQANNLDIQKLCWRKLLEPGWAGELGRDELAYIKAELKKSPSLKRRWGFRPTAKRFSEKQIRAVAGMAYPQKGSSFSFTCQTEKVVHRQIQPKSSRRFADSYKNWPLKLSEAKFRPVLGVKSQYLS